MTMHGIADSMLVNKNCCRLAMVLAVLSETRWRSALTFQNWHGRVIAIERRRPVSLGVDKHRQCAPGKWMARHRTFAPLVTAASKTSISCTLLPLSKAWLAVTYLLSTTDVLMLETSPPKNISTPPAASAKYPPQFRAIGGAPAHLGYGFQLDSRRERLPHPYNRRPDKQPARQH